MFSSFLGPCCCLKPGHLLQNESLQIPKNTVTPYALQTCQGKAATAIRVANASRLRLLLSLY